MGLLIGIPKIPSQSQILACDRKGISNSAGEEEGMRRAVISRVILPAGVKRDNKILVVVCTCGLSTQKTESESGGWQIESQRGQHESQRQRAEPES